MNRRKLSFALFLLTLALTQSALAEDAANTAPHGMDPAKMAEIHRLSTPNENHQVLQPLEGEWSYTSRWWMKPDAQPEQSEGTSSNKWILGGRFMQQDVKGTAMGQPFEGRGIVGYDNVKQEYQSIWLDSMGTGMMKNTGQYDAATKTLTEEGTFSCPMTGEKDMPFRGVLKLVDNDHYTYEMYTKYEGQEFKSGELNYTRK